MSYLITSKQHLSAVSGGGAPSDDKPQTCTVPPPPQPTPAPYVPKTEVSFTGQSTHTRGGGTQNSGTIGVKSAPTANTSVFAEAKGDTNGNFSVGAGFSMGF